MTNINVVNTDKATDLIKECLHSVGPDMIGDVSNTVVNIRNLLAALEEQTRRLSSSVEQAYRERDLYLDGIIETDRSIGEAVNLVCQHLNGAGESISLSHEEINSAFQYLNHMGERFEDDDA